ncbi:uncharacterized protein LY79DRAFT_213477 [Colletotrichum navitas]|uniref:Uncharacterized protein n=1 Tax=Colletotrichum navitas TaxID=681940 RepID=A0AAD8Q0N8_9PEZI|nr:uncharacterized protein LY79DRAFT_213477 [Colletotrichum navitas]KAK1590562.1 hypothetical protein LY79DRAFT_213477 [Colletotrichum navitas]
MRRRILVLAPRHFSSCMHSQCTTHHGLWVRLLKRVAKQGSEAEHAGPPTPSGWQSRSGHLTGMQSFNPPAPRMKAATDCHQVEDELGQQHSEARVACIHTLGMQRNAAFKLWVTPIRPLPQRLLRTCLAHQARTCLVTFPLPSARRTREDLPCSC